MNKILTILFFLPILAFGQPNRIFDLSSMQAPVPTLTIGGSYTAFSTTTAVGSADQTRPITGTLLIGDATFIADAPMQVSVNGSAWDTIAVYHPSSGSLSATLHTRIGPGSTVGSYSGNIRASSPSAAPSLLAFTATVTAAASLSVSPTSLTGLNANAGTAGTAQNIVVTFSGTTVTATPADPTKVEVSKDGGGTYASSQSFSSGSPVTVKARVPASATAGAVSTIIAFSGSGVTTQNVSVTGTVSSVTTNDTINVQMWDSLGHSGASGKYTNVAWNNWAPAPGVTSSLASPYLKYATGVQSPIYVTVDGVNDYAGNGGAYGNTNTMGYPAGVFIVSMYQTSSMTFTFRGVSAGTYKVEMVSSTAAGSGPYTQSFSSGAATQSGVNAFNNLATLVSLDNLSPSSGNITVVITPSNSFTVGNTIRLIRKN